MQLARGGAPEPIPAAAARPLSHKSTFVVMHPHCVTPMPRECGSVARCDAVPCVVGRGDAVQRDAVLSLARQAGAQRGGAQLARTAAAGPVG